MVNMVDMGSAAHPALTQHLDMYPQVSHHHPMPPVVLLRDWDAFLLESLLDDQACDEFIMLADDEGYDTAGIYTGDGSAVAVHIRDCLEAVLEEPGLAESLWQQLAPRLADLEDFAQATAVHPRLRVFRYDEGHKLVPHSDASSSSGDWLSQYSLLVYLNDDYDGGCTAILDGPEPLVIEPRKGLGLCFRHELLHEGQPVVRGTRYLLRGDVLFAE